MRKRLLGSFLVSGVSLLWAQTRPVVLPRGIVNAFTQLPAPATVGRGGIVQINGLNLGPPGGLKASGPTLPMQLGDVQVLINGKPAPLFSVDIGTIVAQVPVDAAVGTADLVVQRASGSSPVAHFTILPASPSVRTADGSGFGMPWGTVSARSLALSGSGLGPTDPAVDSGTAGAGATPRAPVEAYIGGIRTTASASASASRVGEFDISVEIPTGAQQGDLISLMVGNPRANFTTFGNMAAPAVRAVQIPDGSPEFTSLADTDLNGNYLIATGARDSNGCFAGVLFDLTKRTATPIPDCLTTAGRDAIVSPPNSNLLAALIGPPLGMPPAGISSTVKIFDPAQDSPVSVNLPAPALTLAGVGGGNICTLMPGQPPQTALIDAQTGEIGNQPCAPGGGALAGVPGAGGAGALIPNLNVDGLTAQISPAIGVGQGRAALLAADDADRPTKVEFAIVNQQTGRPVASRAFPDGWLPLYAPAPPPPPNGAPGPQAPRFRIAGFLDAAGPAYYVLANNADNSRQVFVSFPLTQGDAAVLPFPDGWYGAACQPALPVFDALLSRSRVLAGSRDATIATRQPCTADGFLQVNLDSGTITALPLASQAQMNVGAMAAMNDYVYSINPTATRGVTDTVFAFDGATGSLLPPMGPSTSIAGFSAQLQQISDLNWLVTEATNRTPGDAGLILFDLDNQVVKPLPLPDGFDSVTTQGIYLATRKVVGLGVRSGGRGSAFIIYDLKSDNVTVVQNPAGIAFLGARGPANRPPGAPGGPGGPGGAAALRGLISANTSANTISAVGLDAQGRQVGIVVVRIP